MCSAISEDTFVRIADDASAVSALSPFATKASDAKGRIASEFRVWSSGTAPSFRPLPGICAELPHANVIYPTGEPAMFCGMPTAKNATVRIGAPIFATLILLLPALWNGFPLLQYDTGGYLARWFEGYLVPSRAVVYGLILDAGVAGCVLAGLLPHRPSRRSGCSALLLRPHGFSRPRWLCRPGRRAGANHHVALARQPCCSPTFSAGLAVLGLHALALRRDRWRRPSAPLDRLIAVAAGSTHSATSRCCSGSAPPPRSRHPSIWRKARSGAARVPWADGGRIWRSAPHGARRQRRGGQRLAWTPGGYAHRRSARMLQDGIVTRYLADHCPRRRRSRLCAYRANCRSTPMLPLGQTRCSTGSAASPGWARKWKSIVLGACAIIRRCRSRPRGRRHRAAT